MSLERDRTFSPVVTNSGKDGSVMPQFVSILNGEGL